MQNFACKYFQNELVSIPYWWDALVAQLDRASDYGSEGCEFEPRRVRHKKPRFVTGFLLFKFGVRTKVRSGSKALRLSHR